MIRTDMIATVGREYLTANIENDEFSYGNDGQATELFADD